jgi:hypothetical protein
MLTLWWWFGICKYKLYCENKICRQIDVEECMRFVLWMMAWHWTDVEYFMRFVLWIWYILMNWYWRVHKICIVNGNVIMR